MSTSNAALLTHSHTVYSAKKRAKKGQIQQVVFDDAARREYLTGFQKRNILKKEAKRKSAKERDRLEKLELRRQHRRELAERAAQNVKEVEGAFGVLPGDVVHAESVGHAGEEELEFEDEEQLAVVTVVEDFATESDMHPTAPAASRASASTPKATTSKAGRNAERSKQRARRTEKAKKRKG